jgi:hypothetical protein
MVNKALMYQQQLEDRIHRLPILSLDTYLFFVSFIFMVMGVMLFIYSFIFDIDPLECDVLSSCIFYLVMDFMFICIYLFRRYSFVIKNG